MFPHPLCECLQTCMSQLKGSHASALSNITNKSRTSLVGLVTAHVKQVRCLITLPYNYPDT